MICEITNHTHVKPIELILKSSLIPLQDINIYECNKTAYCKIFLNGRWLGMVGGTTHHTQVTFREARMNGNINMYSSFEYDVMRQSICIHTDAGRCIRPLLRVENGGVVVAKYLDKIQQITWDSCLPIVLIYPNNVLIILIVMKSIVFYSVILRMS